MEFTKLLRYYNAEYDLIYNFVRDYTNLQILSRLNFLRVKYERLVDMSNKLYEMKCKSNIVCISFIKDFSSKDMNIIDKVFNIFIYIYQKKNCEKIQEVLKDFNSLWKFSDDISYDREFMDWKSQGEKIIFRKMTNLESNGLNFIQQIEYSKLNEKYQLTFFMLNNELQVMNPSQIHPHQKLPIHLQVQEPINQPFWIPRIAEPPIYALEQLQRYGMVPFTQTSPTTNSLIVGINSLNRNIEPVPNGKKVNVVILESDSKKVEKTVLLKKTIEKKREETNILDKCFHGLPMNMKKEINCKKCEKKKCVHGILFYKCSQCRAFCLKHSFNKIKKFNCDKCQKELKESNKKENFISFLDKVNNLSENSE